MKTNTISQSRNRFFAVAMIGALCALGVVGGTYADLSTRTATVVDSETFDSSLRFNYTWADESAPIHADITPATNPEPQTFVKIIDNDSSVVANFALWGGGVDVATIPDSLLDHTKVRLEVTDGTRSGAVEVTLRQFLTNAIVFDGNNDNVTRWNGQLGAFDDLTVTVHVTAPNNSSPVDFSDAIGFETINFNSIADFNQVINGTSSMVTYAQANGTSVNTAQFPFGSRGAWLVPLTSGGIGY